MKYCILEKNSEETKAISDKLRELIKFEYDDVSPDIVLCIGGDGTILRAVHHYKDIIEKIIIFGIHAGKLGFYTNYSLDMAEKVAEEINTNSFVVEKIDLLEYEIVTKKNIIIGHALNEVTIVNPRRTLILDVFIDDEYLETFRGTGLCVSTPYGSTAYNKSLTGAVVEPTLKSLQLTEIASINSNAYRTLGSSLVLNSKRIIKLIPTSNSPVVISADNLNYEINDLSSLTIKESASTVKMAMSFEKTFFERIKRTFI